MKASQFIEARGKPAPSLPVDVTLVCEVDSLQEIREAKACFRFLPDRLRNEAESDAAKAVATLVAKGVPVPEEVRIAIIQSHIIHAAVRDSASPAEPFFDGPADVQRLLMPSERQKILALYQGWIEMNFPTDWTSDRFKEAMADAEGFSVPALLTKYGYDITRLCVIFLASTPSTRPTT